MKISKSHFFSFAGVAFLVLAATAQVGVLPKRDVRLKEASDPTFRIGDLWEYKTRPGEEQSRLTVLKIDNSPELGVIVHIAVDNLTWKDCQYNPIPESIPHKPFARRAVNASVTKRVASAQLLPNYKSGYEEWR